MQKNTFLKLDLFFFIPILFFLFLSCQKEKVEDPFVPPPPTVSEILSKMESDYEQMAEQEMAISQAQNVVAQYAGPVTRYSHGILGDAIEASQLVVNIDGVFYQHDLSEDYVFEDIRPRLFDVDSDGQLEFVCIRTHVDLGAGIAIYKLVENTLTEYAFVKEIGTRNRWLNIVAVHDLDADGTVELVWIQTPHIGGILKIAKIKQGELDLIHETSLYSNHAIGEKNLCLSVLTENEGAMRIYVPNQQRNKIFGFSYENERLEIKEEITLDVDFSLPLWEQYTFENRVEEEDNCIDP